MCLTEVEAGLDLQTELLPPPSPPLPASRPRSGGRLGVGVEQSLLAPQVKQTEAQGFVLPALWLYKPQGSSMTSEFVSPRSSLRTHLANDCFGFISFWCITKLSFQDVRSACLQILKTASY